MRVDRVCGDWTDIIDRGGNMRAAIAGFVRKQLEEIINKVNILHLIFDLNSTTYAETYVISTRWIKLGFLVQTSPLSS